MGMWLQLLPSWRRWGAFLTYKSNNDSVVLNADAYTSWIKRVIGIRGVRHLFKKEIITMTGLFEDFCGTYCSHYRMSRIYK